jgi:flagellar biogenesis protein FliO
MEKVMKRFCLFILITTISLAAQAKLKITNIDFSQSAESGVVRIDYVGQINQVPTLSFREDMVQLELDGSIWPQVTKSVKFLTTEKNDTKILGYQFAKGTTRVRTHLPYNAEKMQKQITLDLKGSAMYLTFPKNVNSGAMIVTSKNEDAKNAAKDTIDEKYLDQLIKAEETTEPVAPTVQAPAGVKKDALESNKPTLDGVKSTQSSLLKSNSSEKSEFSIMSYAGKFVAFLGFVLLLFYGVIQLFKKGVVGKSRLSFLGSTKQVEVLSTTHIAPKKSMMLVRVHKQVFLIGNTETGMNLISEIKEPAALIKGDIQDISGTNFDTELNHAVESDARTAKVRLKQERQAEAEQSDSSLSAFLAQTQVQDTVEIKNKFSDQIKKKVKGLKPLQ